MKDLMKKKWFWPVAVFAVLIVIAVIGQASGLITPRESAPPAGQSTNPPATVTPSATPEATPEATPDAAPTAPEAVTIDFDKCIEDTTAELTDKSNFPYVEELRITVNQDDKKISFTAALQDGTDAEDARKFADTMIRRFHLTVTTFEDDSLKAPGKDYYGGLYDTYAIEIGVAPNSAVGDASKWWVIQDIPAGSHLPIVLSK